MEAAVNLFKDYPDILTVNDVKSMLRIGKNKAYHLITTEIPHYQLGKIYYVTKEDLICYIKNKS